MIATIKSRLVIRDVVTSSEVRAVEELQKEVWGIPDLDVVPLSEMVAVKTAGGVLIGAFDGIDLVGFVYGFVSLEDGQVGHHSHMLAVRRSYRGFHLGQDLKLAQRDRVLKQGIKIMSWTFDPLQSLNAYLNFNRLGVVANQYFFDFYSGDASSFLHQNGTDRLWVKWLLESDRVTARLSGPPALNDRQDATQLIKLVENLPDRRELDSGTLADQVAIEIPGDINSLERKSRRVAAEWRRATRDAFTVAFEAGYTVTGYSTSEREGKRVGTYLLQRHTTPDLT